MNYSGRSFRVGLLALSLVISTVPVVAQQKAANQKASQRPRLDHTRYVVIGDFGLEGTRLQSVADLLDSLDPDYVITAGDNNYPSGGADTIDQNIGQYFSRFIGPYYGAYGSGSDFNNFYPVLGNRDYSPTEGAQPYLDYFELPGNERYYWVRRGMTEFFMLNSDKLEPDDQLIESGIQAQWLKAKLAASKARYKIVVLHHPPFGSSSSGSSSLERQLPFTEWGADAVISGHMHHYERFDIEGTPYFVNGLGGVSRGKFSQPGAGSQSRFNSEYGVMLAEVSKQYTRFRFLSIEGAVDDDYHLFPFDPTLPSEELSPTQAEWHYLDEGQDPGAGWELESYDDSSWDEGDALFGYREGNLGTLLDIGNDAFNPAVTAYFRREFDLVGASGITELEFKMRVDDGAIAYLNGTEIGRYNMPAGPVNLHTLALAPQINSTEDSFFAFAVDPSLLLEGENLLAVELHAGAMAGLRAEYFDADFPPALPTYGEFRQVDPTVDFTWTGDAPDDTTIIADDQYSVRWLGAVLVETPGTWTFTTVSNDGVRLWVNGQMIIDNWTNHTSTSDSAQLSFAQAGWYPIQMDYYNDGGTAVAKLQFSGPGQNQIIIPSTHLKADMDDIAYEPGKTDGFIDLSMHAFRGSQALLAKGSLWNYLDDGSAPAMTWIDPSFDDSSWSFGNAQLGNGDGDEVTVIDDGPDPDNRYITSYYRHEFSVTDASEWNTLLLRLLRDDGAVVYLNGTEVYRFNLPIDGVDGNTLAEYRVSDEDEDTFFESRIDHNLLVDGTNLVAVEIHRRDNDDPDVSFDMELWARP